MPFLCRKWSGTNHICSFVHAKRHKAVGRGDHCRNKHGILRQCIPSAPPAIWCSHSSRWQRSLWHSRWHKDILHVLATEQPEQSAAGSWRHLTLTWLNFLLKQLRNVPAVPPIAQLQTQKLSQEGQEQTTGSCYTRLHYQDIRNECKMLLEGSVLPTDAFLFLLELQRISEESSNLFYIYPNWLLFFALEGAANCVCSLSFL